MSFLDNLENNLKSLESREEGDQAAEQQRRSRERERANAQAAAPYAEQLKKGPFTAELMRQAARIGHEKRIKVNLLWLGTTLRLEVRERRLELRPAPGGINVVYCEDGREIRTEPLDLHGSAEDLIRRWLS